MIYCPECETNPDIDEEEVDEGEIVSCPECGTGTITRSARMPVFSSRISLRFLTALLCFVALPIFPHKVLANPAAALYQRPDQPYALIFGTVWGPDDHPLYGVKVKIRLADQKKAHWDLYSDHHVEFAQRVPPGPADYLV